MCIRDRSPFQLSFFILKPSSLFASKITAATAATAFLKKAFCMALGSISADNFLQGSTEITYQRAADTAGVHLFDLDTGDGTL